MIRQAVAPVEKKFTFRSHFMKNTDFIFIKFAKAALTMIRIGRKVNTWQNASRH